MRPVWIVDRFLQLVLEGDAASLRALLAPDYRLYENDRLVVVGREAGVERVLGLREAFPRRSVRIHERVAAGNRVGERWTIEAWLAAGTGSTRRPVRIDGASWTVCQDGLIAEVRQWWDAADLERQLADAPPSPAPIPPAFARPGVR